MNRPPPTARSPQDQMLRNLDAQTHALTHMVATGRWDEAVLLSRSQDRALVQLCSSPIGCDEREHARRLLGAVLESIGSMLTSLEHSRAACAARLAQIQQARRAMRGYRVHEHAR